MAKYVNDEKLTDSIIEEILNKCGLEIIKTKEDYMTGKVVEINSIIRGDENIMVSCRNNEDAEMAQAIYNRFPMLGMFAKGPYSVGDEVVMFDDFFASRMKLNDEIEPLDQKLFDVYHETMCSLFGEEYEKDANACFDEIIAEQNKEKKDEKTTQAEMGAE